MEAEIIRTTGSSRKEIGVVVLCCEFSKKRLHSQWQEPSPGTVPHRGLERAEQSHGGVTGYGFHWKTEKSQNSIYSAAVNGPFELKSEE